MSENPIKIDGALADTAPIARDVASGVKTESKNKVDPAMQNPMYHKRVVFVEDENDPVNADAVRGHLEVVGEREYSSTFYEKYIKRVIDVVLSVIGLIVFSPLLAVTAIAIKLDDPGPVIFRQKRISRGNGYFELMKFRSMRLDTPHNVPTHQLENPDKYLLKSGKLIRKLSIDELPQLLNIIKGSMSIVGPRPALWNQEFLIGERDRYGANDVRPGLTGLAQMSGRDELEIPVKAKLDGEYTAALKKSSLSGFLMDVRVFFGSILTVLKRDGVVEGRKDDAEDETAEDESHEFVGSRQ